MKKKVGTGTKIPSLVITPLSGISVEEILKYEPILRLVRNQVPVGIENAIAGKKEEATIVEINHSGHYIVISSEFWKNALDTCLSYYTDQEDFENCIEVQRVQKKLEEYNKIPTSIRTASKKRKANGRE